MQEESDEEDGKAEGDDDEGEDEDDEEDGEDGDEDAANVSHRTLGLCQC